MEKNNNPYSLNYNHESIHFTDPIRLSDKKKIWDRITKRQEAAKELQKQYEKYRQNR